MLTLECYWVESTAGLDMRHTEKFQSECVGTLIQQAFLKKMSVLDWVGYRIQDQDNNTVQENFTVDSLCKSRYAQAQNK